MDGATNTMSAVYAAHTIERTSDPFDYAVLFGCAGGLPRSGGLDLGDVALVQKAVYVEWGNLDVDKNMGGSVPVSRSKRQAVTTARFSQAIAVAPHVGIHLTDAICTDKVVHFDPNPKLYSSSDQNSYEYQLASGDYSLVDMESYGFYAGLQNLNRKAVSIRTITDRCGDKNRLGDIQQQQILRESGIPALRAVIDHWCRRAADPTIEDPTDRSFRIYQDAYWSVARMLVPQYLPAAKSYVHRVREARSQYWDVRVRSPISRVYDLAISLARYVSGSSPERVSIRFSESEELATEVAQSLLAGTAEPPSDEDESLLRQRIAPGDSRTWAAESAYQLERLTRSIEDFADGRVSDSSQDSSRSTDS
jgi:purine-nucleoside phosphorylase